MSEARVSQIRISILLAARDIAAKLRSPWLYVLTSLALAIVAFFATAFHRSFETETVAVAADPFAVVHAIVLLFLGVGLGVRAAATLSWEREHRTLEVLLAGPVTVGALVSAKIAAEIVILMVVNLAYSAYALGALPTVGSGSGLSGIIGYWRLSLLVLPLIGLGFVIAAVASTVRTAIIANLLVVLALAALEGSALWLQAQDPNALSLAALYMRGIVSVAVEWLRPVSPIAYAADLATVAAGGTPPDGLRLLSAGILAFALALGSMVLTRWRGAIG